MIAPGPLLAAVCAFPGGLLGSRFSHRSVGTVGSVLFALAALWWIWRIGLSPDYVGAYLPGSVLTGIGVGLMLPSLGGAATAPLPPERFATGTATGVAAIHAFDHAWIFMATCSLLGGLILQGILRRTPVWLENVEVVAQDHTTYALVAASCD
jgi:MFS family permease